MISLSALLRQLSEFHGTEINFEKQDGENSNLRIVFSNLSPNFKFHLRLSRTWRTSQIVFEPGVFSGQLLSYLAVQVGENLDRLLPILRYYKEKSVRTEIRINGQDILVVGHESIDNFGTLSFMADVLTVESSIEFSLLNDAEADLVRLAISVFAILLLPISSRLISPDEVSGFPEGAVERIEVNKYERDARNRQIAIEIHGLDCAVCGFNFERTYGSLGSRFIVIHHKTPVSEIGPGYLIDPENDLVPLCANCHAMVHSASPALDVDELRAFRNNSIDS